MKKRSNLMLVLLFLVGLAFVLYPTLSDLWNQRVQTAVVNDYDAKVEEIDNTEYERMFAEAHAFNDRLFREGLSYADAKRITGYEETLNVTGDGIMAYVEIDKIGVKLPIYHGTSDSALAVAVGHLKGTSLPVGGENTHAAISSHRGLPSARLFTDLDKLEEGDTFTITVLSDLLTYQVEKIQIVEPHVVRPLDIVEGKDLFTLVTCTPYGINTHRLLITGERVDNALNRNYRIVSDARRMDPLTLAPYIGILLLILLLPFMLGGGKKTPAKQPTRGSKPGHRPSGRGKQAFTSFLALLLLVLWGYPGTDWVQAASFPDQTSSLQLKLQGPDDQAEALGGNVQLYQLADLVEDQGQLAYQVKPEFSAWEIPSEPTNPQFAQELQAFVADQGLASQDSKALSAQGEVHFSNLAPGLYLLVHQHNNPAYYPFNPFLISLPHMQGEGTGASWQYQVEAYPKVYPRPEEETPTSTSQPSPSGPNPGDETPQPEGSEPDNLPDNYPGGWQSSTSSSYPSSSAHVVQPTPPPVVIKASLLTPAHSAEKLPFTSIVRWPMPLLAILGILSLAYGYYLRKSV